MVDTALSEEVTVFVGADSEEELSVIDSGGVKGKTYSEHSQIRRE